MIKYRLNSNVYLYNSNDNENYIIDLETNNSFRLNHSSYNVCLLIEDESVSFDVIVEKIYEMYNTTVEKGVLTNDLQTFISELSDKSFVIIEE